MSLPKNNPFKNEPEIVKDIKRIMEGWVQGDAEDFLNENTISEGGVKGAIEDFMYDTLPQAAVKELQPVFKNKSIRGGQLRDKVSSILKKHKIPTFFMGTSATQVVIDNFETYFGESVEEAYAPLDTPNLIGAFTETTKKKRFEYRKSTDKWGISHGLPHEVCVKETSPSEWRAANVKGTVCYIATDEGEGGKPVIEKWAIRNHVKYVKAEEIDQEGEEIKEAYGNPFTPRVPGTFAAPNFKAGDKVKVPHKGKMVKGKIVRYDDGGTGKAKQHGGGYVVDVGEPASILVPKQNVQKEEVEVNELTNLRTYNNAYPNTMIASSKEMGEANNDQAVKAAILTLQSAVNMASNPSKYGNLKVINAIEQAIKQLKSATK